MKEKRTNTGRAQKGYLVLLLGLFAVLLFTGVSTYRGLRAIAEITRIGRATAQVEQFRLALVAYKQDMGRFPGRHEGLEALVRNPGEPRWRGPYLASSFLPSDPWGKQYVYTTWRAAPFVASAGPDGRVGNQDDILIAVHGGLLGPLGHLRKPPIWLSFGRVHSNRRETACTHAICSSCVRPWLHAA